MRERLVVQTNDPPEIGVVSIVRSGTTATVTTVIPHGFVVTDYCTIAGCSGATTAFNAKWKVVTVPSTTTFTFTCSGSLTTPATGTILVVYTSNASGGMGANGAAWRTLDSLSAEMIPLGAMERLQIRAVQSSVSYRFRVRARADLAPTMRLLWTPSYPAGVARKTLEIAGILPMGDGRQWQYIEASEA
jgi:hypothetical protein